MKTSKAPMTKAEIDELRLDLLAEHIANNPLPKKRGWFFSMLMDKRKTGNCWCPKCKKITPTGPFYKMSGKFSCWRCLKCATNRCGEPDRV